VAKTGLVMGVQGPGKSTLIVGAESTGKTTLAHYLGQQTGQTVLPEVLRQWVIKHGRAPHQSEQSLLWELQVAQQTACTNSLGWIAEGGVVMTAAYSEAYFGDATLWPDAVAQLLQIHQMLWCRPTGFWQAEPGMRDGQNWQAEVDKVLQNRLASLGVWTPWPGSQDRADFVNRLAVLELRDLETPFAM
jgi:nicotinamide riboside kinase